MIVGWLPLYLRSRYAATAVIASLAAAAVVLALWVIWSDDAQVRPDLATLTVLAVLAPWIRTLAGHDADLEKTAAMPWPPRRVLHLLSVGVVVAGVLLSAEVVGIHFGAMGQILRNSAGLAGLIGLCAALFGTGLAPIPTTIWVAVQAFAGATGGPVWRQSLFWMMQPAGNKPAAVTAAVLFLAGAIAYALRVGPPRPPSEATMEQ
ncbi:hypothetical protein [Actinoplanes friuliensis]|uniref:Uncharacterized protein n=1 Tax=Actinoplanes friuliensis DSM 7358 TaxID=1246995 RepID=U5VYU7_9ACTN|nr:hypothetical protein [Actinoplanes friuliensis]AGZ40846.1 hypothetical protein AFR_12800 [Actinoplanes friuliensis DSM 7358]